MLTLTAANTYNGGTTVNDGTLQLGNPSALGTGGLTVTGGELDLNANSVSLLSLSGNGGTVSDESSSSGSATVLTVVQGTTTTFGGTIRDGLSGQQVALAMSGTGTLILTGSNTYSGGTTINAGVLQFGTGAGTVFQPPPAALSSTAVVRWRPPARPVTARRPTGLTAA